MSTMSKTPLVLGLCGLIGSGKDTTADILEKYGFRRVSFASCLKDVCAIMFGWDREVLEGRDRELRKQREVKDPYWSKALGRDMTPRLMLQLMGTEIMRNTLSKDIWMKILEKKILDGEYGKKVVVTDVRFLNECQLVRRLGGKVARLVRGSIPKWEKQLASGVSKEDIPDLPHVSEWAWLGHEDMCIPNVGTRRDLETVLVQEFKLHSRPNIVKLWVIHDNVTLGSREYCSNMNILTCMMDLGYAFGLQGNEFLDGCGTPILNHKNQTVSDLKKVLGKDMKIYVT